MDRLPRALVNGIGDEVLLFSTTVLFVVMSVLIFFVKLCIRYFRRRDENVGTQAEEVPPPPGYNRDICPICIERHSFPVETNCGHLFCGMCLNECYRHQHGFAMPCPLCRHKINLLFVCFPTLVDESAELMTRQQEVFSFVNFYNRGCAGFPLSNSLRENSESTEEFFQLNQTPDKPSFPKPFKDMRALKRTHDSISRVKKTQDTSREKEAYQFMKIAASQLTDKDKAVSLGKW